MTRSSQEVFEERIVPALSALRSFFADIRQSYDQDKVAFARHTKANSGDMRLANRGPLLGQQRNRNFATLCWRPCGRSVL